MWVKTTDIPRKVGVYRQPVNGYPSGIGSLESTGYTPVTGSVIVTFTTIQ